MIRLEQMPGAGPLGGGLGSPPIYHATFWYTMGMTGHVYTTASCTSQRLQSKWCMGRASQDWFKAKKTVYGITQEHYAKCDGCHAWVSTYLQRWGDYEWKKS